MGVKALCSPPGERTMRSPGPRAERPQSTERSFGLSSAVWAGRRIHVILGCALLRHHMLQLSGNAFFTPRQGRQRNGLQRCAFVRFFQAGGAWFENKNGRRLLRRRNGPAAGRAETVAAVCGGAAVRAGGRHRFSEPFCKKFSGGFRACCGKRCVHTPLPAAEPG